MREVDDVSAWSDEVSRETSGIDFEIALLLDRGTMNQTLPLRKGEASLMIFSEM